MEDKYNETEKMRGRIKKKTMHKRMKKRFIMNRCVEYSWYWQKIPE